MCETAADMLDLYSIGPYEMETRRRAAVGVTYTHHAVQHSTFTLSRRH